MIAISHLYKTYNPGRQEVKALWDVTLNVNPGEIFGVVGPSGAGKSTLIRCVNLLERPSAGSIFVNGQEMTTLSPADLRLARQNIGMIFQHFNLLSSRTVSENVAFPLEILDYSKSQRAKRVEELLGLVGLSDKAGVYPAQLSGGQKQRVGIARALATQPKILLSDEATSALDPQTTISILNLLKDLNRQLGLTILLITHEMVVVKEICDHVAVLENGRVVEQGELHDLVAKPGSQLSRSFFPLLEGTPVLPGATQVIITFIGNTADKPILASLVRKFNVDVNIVGGSIQNIGGERMGQLQVEIMGEQTGLALGYLRSIGLQVEVR